MALPLSSARTTVPVLLLTDVAIEPVSSGQDDNSDGPLLVTTALWNVSTQFESKVLHGADAGRSYARSAPGWPRTGFARSSISASARASARMRRR